MRKPVSSDFANEHAMAGRLREDSVVASDGLMPLADLLDKGPLPAASAARVAAAVATALEELHCRQVVHLGLTPESILIDVIGWRARLNDIGRAVPLSSDSCKSRAAMRQDLANPAYMAPEQTGRTSGAIGPATDFYALGIVLFQLLTGKLPFNVVESSEWFHAHIAYAPIPLCSLNPTLPKALESLVTKLLEKAPEDRYHSAAGLAWDLFDCARRIESGAGWNNFRIGLHDSRPTLSIPTRLYGRDRDREALRLASLLAAEGRSRLLTVVGPAGIGKSALIQEARRNFAGKGGHFVFGKFDERNRGTPYASLIQALRDLVRQILAEPDAMLAYWRAKLLAALGANARLIVDVIRQAELILGPQRPLPEVPPVETKTRFQRALRDFVRAFAEPGRPLAIFLDDMHWSDAASMDLIRHILADGEAQHLLIVGAYRDNEVGVDHPLRAALREATQAEVPVDVITLAPLDAEAVAALVIDTLRTPSAEALGRLIADRTDGNPLFVRQFLLNLRDQELLAYDTDAARWHWNLDQLADAELPDNIADLMARRLSRLSPDAQEALGIAACIGNRFSVATVAAVARREPPAIVAALAEAGREGLIVRIDDTGCHRFTHDRIQQSAYLSFDEAKRRAHHLAAGRAMLRQFEPDSENVFDIANQFQHGLTEISDPEERRRLSLVFAHAGGRAKAAGAPQASRAYLASGVELAGVEIWRDDPALATQLFSDLAESEFLCGNIDAAESMFARVLARATKPSDIARLHVLHLHLNMSRNRADLAVDTACDGLRRLGVDLSARPGKPLLLAEIARIALALSRRRIEDLADLPWMNDPHQQAVMSIYMNLTVAAYFVDRDLLALVAMRMVSLSIRHGNAGASAYAYVAFGMVVGGGFGKLREGFRFGELGRRVGAASGDPRHEGLSLAMCGIFTGAWGQPATVSLEQLRRAHRLLLDCGDPMMTNYAAIASSFHDDGMGKPLTEVADGAKARHEFVRGIRFDDSASYFISLQRKVACLRGETDRPGDLAGSGYDEGKHLAAMRNSPELTALAWHFVNRLQASFLFGDLAAAKRNADELALLSEISLGQAYVPRQWFYAAMTEAALAIRATGAARRRHLRALGRARARLEPFATTAPFNFGHLDLLVAAEDAALRNRCETAMRLFELALRKAADNGCNHDRALANERFGTFFLARGLDSAATPYLRNAVAGYRQWGAEALARELERRHPRLLTPAVDTTAASLDLETVVKAARALSGEIEFADLRGRLMEALAEHAGAARALLILKRHETLMIEDEWLAGGGSVGTEPKPVEQRSDLAYTVVRYAARTLADIVIDDAARDQVFAGDAYLASGEQRSVLCMPMVRHGSMLGLIYMENPLIDGAFDAGRLRVLHILTAQFAIAIENATLRERLHKGPDG